ncbi:MAG: hypothetical protein ACQEV6_17675 [Pseudomonadota bacterium]
MVGFLVAVGVFVMRDAKHQKQTEGKRAQHPTGKAV